MGISEDTTLDILNRVKAVGILQKGIPYYVKAKASVVTGKIDFTTYEVKIGRLSIAGDQVDKYKADLISAAMNRINSVPSFSCKNFSSDGKIHFEGTLPTSVQRAVKGK